jgi:undecaprenyl-diphosphatase
MGITQGLALLPGISRSGSTLVCGLIYGVEKEQALDFSFLMSIPIIIASAVFETIKLFTCQITVNWLGIFIVILTSFIFGIISIKLMLKIVKKNKLYFFSIYLIILSLIILIF